MNPAALGPLVTFKEVEEESNSDSGSTPILPRPGADQAVPSTSSSSIFTKIFGSKSSSDGGVTASSSKTDEELARELHANSMIARVAVMEGVTASPSKTDEELARELQRQFDEEGR